MSGRFRGDPFEMPSLRASNQQLQQSQSDIPKSSPQESPHLNSILTTSAESTNSVDQIFPIHSRFSDLHHNNHRSNTINNNDGVYIDKRSSHHHFHSHPHDSSGIKDNIGSAIVVNTKSFMEIIYEGYLERNCTVCGKKNIFLDSFTSKGGSPSLYLRCHTNGCIWSKTIRTSEPIRDKNGRRLRCSELPAKMVYSFLLSGLTYQNYDEIMDILEIDHFSQPQFNFYCEKMDSTVTALLDPILFANRKELGDSGKSFLVLDGRWSSRGWNANECTVSFFNGLTGVLVHVEHVIRKMYPSDIHGNYVGAASSSMEGFGIEKAMQLFHEENIPIDVIVHDHDGETMKIVRQYYPDALEMNDVGHRGKLFKKAIIQLQRTYPELRGLGDRCLKALMFSIHNCHGSTVTFSGLMKQQFDHFCNISHSHCTHHSSYTPRNWSYITSENARQTLWNEFQKVIDIADRYIQNMNTNAAAEAFNSQITKFAPKRLNFHAFYRMRANLAALSRVLPNYKVHLLNVLNCPVSNNMQRKFELSIDKKTIRRERRLTAEARQQKVKNARKKKKRNVNEGNNVKYIYKGKGAKGSEKPLTINQMRTSIQSLGYKIPSKVRNREQLKALYDNFLLLDNIYISIDPLEIPDEGDGEVAF